MTKEQIQKKIDDILNALNRAEVVPNNDMTWVCLYTLRLDGVAREVLQHLERISDAEFHPRIRLECALRNEPPPKNLRKERKGNKLGY